MLSCGDGNVVQPQMMVYTLHGISITWDACFYTTKHDIHDQYAYQRPCLGLAVTSKAEQVEENSRKQGSNPCSIYPNMNT